MLSGDNVLHMLRFVFLFWTACRKWISGGRNGYGAKLCNIFSTEFTVETSSREYGKAFKQVRLLYNFNLFYDELIDFDWTLLEFFKIWKNNMTKDKDPFVSKSTGEDFTRITFKPDLAKFKMTELDDDIISLISRRAYDVAGSTKGVKVYLNDKLLPVKILKHKSVWIFISIYSEQESVEVVLNL